VGYAKSSKKEIRYCQIIAPNHVFFPLGCGLTGPLTSLFETILIHFFRKIDSPSGSLQYDRYCHNIHQTPAANNGFPTYESKTSHLRH